MKMQIHALEDLVATQLSVNALQYSWIPLSWVAT